MGRFSVEIVRKGILIQKGTCILILFLAAIAQTIRLEDVSNLRKAIVCIVSKHVLLSLCWIILDILVVIACSCYFKWILIVKSIKFTVSVNSTLQDVAIAATRQNSVELLRFIGFNIVLQVLSSKRGFPRVLIALAFE